MVSAARRGHHPSAAAILLVGLKTLSVSRGRVSARDRGLPSHAGNRLGAPGLMCKHLSPSVGGCRAVASNGGRSHHPRCLLRSPCSAEKPRVAILTTVRRIRRPYPLPRGAELTLPPLASTMVQWAACVAASAALLFGAWWALPILHRRADVHDGNGRATAVKLAGFDGVSQHALSVQVHFSSHLREVRLREGEALFVVERDPVRPFQVVTNTAIVQAVVHNSMSTDVPWTRRCP